MILPALALGASRALFIYNEARNINTGCNSSTLGFALAVYKQLGPSRDNTLNAFLQHINRIIHHSMSIILILPRKYLSHLKVIYGKSDPIFQGSFFLVENLA